MTWNEYIESIDIRQSGNDYVQVTEGGGGRVLKPREIIELRLHYKKIRV